MKKAMIIILSIALLASCAEIDPKTTSTITNEAYCWYNGLFHGLITPISFIASLFNDKYIIYASNNTGGWYDFWFLIGASGFGALSGSSSKN